MPRTPQQNSKPSQRSSSSAAKVSSVCAIPTKVMGDLRNNNFLMVDGVLHDAIKHLFAMTSTVKIEFANRATRQQEDRNQDSCRLSAQRIQIAPYKQKVMHQFGYDELLHPITRTRVRERHGLQLLKPPTTIQALLNRSFPFAGWRPSLRRQISTRRRLN